MNTPSHSLFSIRLLFVRAFCRCNLSAAPEAREVEGIAAIVNDEVISLYDVDQRVELYFVSRALPPRETVERLREQALRELVDENCSCRKPDEWKSALKKRKLSARLIVFPRASAHRRPALPIFLKNGALRNVHWIANRSGTGMEPVYPPQL